MEQQQQLTPRMKSKLAALEAWSVEEYLSEFIGTFFLVLTIGLNVSQNTAMAPLSMGFILMAMTFASDKVSGGHFNPAVTIAIQLTNGLKLTYFEACGYMVAQLVAGLLGGFVACNLLGASSPAFAPGQDYGELDVLLAEVLFSTALVFTFLGSAAVDVGNLSSGGCQFKGLAMGLLLVAAAFAIGGISGCCLNPALAFGLMLPHWVHGGGSLRYLPLYVMSPAVGSLVAAGLFRAVRGKAFPVATKQPLAFTGLHTASGYGSASNSLSLSSANQ